MTRRCHLALAATIVLLLAGDRARADLVNFSYHWTIEPGSVLSSGMGNVSFDLVPDGVGSAEQGQVIPIPGVLVTTSSFAPPPPDLFDAPFRLNLHLTDNASGATGTLRFAGTITGALTETESTLVSTFTTPLTQVLDLGAHRYEVTIDPAVANLPFPGSEAPALLDALVTLTPRTAETPEPSSLALGAPAAALLALTRRRRA